MIATVDRDRFGPWALITGASSGIGREFARQLAASGINVVIVARRAEKLDDLRQELIREFSIQCRAVAADLTEDAALERVLQATRDLDLGLVISNAGISIPGEFFNVDLAVLEKHLRLNSRTHLNVIRVFGQSVAKRGRGGLLLVGAMGGSNGVPYMANDAGAKAYVRSLGVGLHDELAPKGIHVTVLLPGMTDTDVVQDLGLTRESSPLKPMGVEQVVFEALVALQKNRATIIPGRTNRFINAVVPDSITRRMMGKMFAQTLSKKPPDNQAQ
jgi:short-subunit dehydrogenase